MNQILEGKGMTENGGKMTWFTCPYCGSDRVQPVTNSKTREESYFCQSCEMEWGEPEQVREEIAQGSEKNINA